MIALREEHPLIRCWSEGDAYHMDVRELLEQGGEPYVHIMDCVNQIGPGEALVVHALFEPKPLVAQIGRMGLQATSERVDEDHWALRITAAE
jgi:N-dimethylarginine dimethylaminohydrolase